MSGKKYIKYFYFIRLFCGGLFGLAAESGFNCSTVPAAAGSSCQSERTPKRTRAPPNKLPLRLSGGRVFFLLFLILEGKRRCNR